MKLFFWTSQKYCPQNYFQIFFPPGSSLELSRTYFQLVYLVIFTRTVRSLVFLAEMRSDWNRLVSGRMTLFDVFSCANGQTVDKASCPAGQSLSYHRQKCLPESSVTCVKSHCKLGHDGFFILPGSTCQAYYLCSKGVRSQFVCPQGHVFSLKSKVIICFQKRTHANGRAEQKQTVPTITNSSPATR